MTNSPTPFDRLEKLFHEPKRLAIVSLLCTAKEGASFADLKRGCQLTDGNLNRHLNTLEQGGVIQAVKEPQRKGRPHTIVHLTPEGRAQFNQYLQALEGALKLAVDALHREEQARQPAPQPGFGEATAW